MNKPKFMSDMTRREWFYFGLIILGAILFRLLLMSKTYAIGFDEVNYLKLAASGRINGLNHVLHAYWSPFYPLAVALFSYLVPDFETAGRWLQILSALGILTVAFFFARNRFGKRVAWGTALLIAFFTLTARFSVKAETDFIYGLLALAGVVLGWSALEKKRLGHAFTAGLLFGFFYFSIY